MRYQTEMTFPNYVMRCMVCNFKVYLGILRYTKDTSLIYKDLFQYKVHSTLKNVLIKFDANA